MSAEDWESLKQELRKEADQQIAATNDQTRKDSIRADLTSFARLPVPTSDYEIVQHRTGNRVSNEMGQRRKDSRMRDTLLADQRGLSRRGGLSGTPRSHPPQGASAEQSAPPPCRVSWRQRRTPTRYSVATGERAHAFAVNNGRTVGIKPHPNLGHPLAMPHDCFYYAPTIARGMTTPHITWSNGISPTMDGNSIRTPQPCSERAPIVTLAPHSMQVFFARSREIFSAFGEFLTTPPFPGTRHRTAMLSRSDRSVDQAGQPVDDVEGELSVVAAGDVHAHLLDRIGPVNLGRQVAGLAHHHDSAFAELEGDALPRPAAETFLRSRP